jgi:hypothetical protein
MELRKLRRLFYAIVYGIFGVILGIILIRIILRLIGASESASFVKFWYTFSDGFLSMFKGIYPDLNTNTGILYIEVYAVIGMIFYLLLALIFSKALTSVLAVHPMNILKNIIDVLFKVLEATLILRFIFKMTGASTTSSFVDFIYKLSSFIYQPFAGILPAISVKELNLVFETSTLIAIIVIIIFDIITEGIINRLYKAVTDNELEDENKIRRGYHKVPVEHTMSHVSTTPIQHQPVPRNAQPTVAPQSASNITINIPQQTPVTAPVAQQPPTYVDNRSIKVYPNNKPTQPVYNQYPGYADNDLEKQNPARVQQLPNQYQNPQPVTGQNTHRNTSPRVP